MAYLTFEEVVQATITTFTQIRHRFQQRRRRYSRYLKLGTHTKRCTALLCDADTFEYPLEVTLEYERYQSMASLACRVETHIKI